LLLICNAVNQTAHAARGTAYDNNRPDAQPGEGLARACIISAMDRKEERVVIQYAVSLLANGAAC